MTIQEKIRQAREYVKHYEEEEAMGLLVDMGEVRENAADIYGETPEERMKISIVLLGDINI